MMDEAIALIYAPWEANPCFSPEKAIHVVADILLSERQSGRFIRKSAAPGIWHFENLKPPSPGGRYARQEVSGVDLQAHG